GQHPGRRRRHHPRRGHRRLRHRFPRHRHADRQPYLRRRGTIARRPLAGRHERPARHHGHRIPQLLPHRGPQHRAGPQLDDLHDRIPAELHPERPAPPRLDRKRSARTSPLRPRRMECPAPAADAAHCVGPGRLRELVPRCPRLQHLPVARLHPQLPRRHPPDRPRRIPPVPGPHPHCTVRPDRTGGSVRLPDTLRPPRPTRVLRVRSADGTMLHAEVHGPEDAPTVVFSHGWTCSTLVWLPILRVLGDSIRAVLYDQRGHGRSETPRRSGYSTTALADDLCAVLHATVPRGTRVAVVGHSMGGMTLMAAADRPEFRSRVAAALLASTGSHALVPGAHVVGGASLLRSAFHRMLLTAPLPLGPITPLTRAGLRYVTMSPGSSPEMVDLCVRMVHACRALPRARWGAVLRDLDLSAAVPRLD